MGRLNAYQKGGLVVAFLILALVSLWVLYSPNLAVNTDPAQYKTIARMERDGAPDFELPMLDGTRFRLSSTRGKITIVNFWASWCNPCVEEFPSLIKLLQKFKGSVVLVAVSADEDKNDIEAFLKAFAANGADVRVVWDKDRKTADAWAVGKIPESYLLGKDGKLIRKVLGIENWASHGALDYFAELVAH